MCEGLLQFPQRTLLLLCNDCISVMPEHRQSDTVMVNRNAIVLV